MKPSYDESQWPYVVVTMPAEAPSDQEFSAHLQKMRDYFARRELFGLVFDVRQAPPLSAERRRLVAELLDAETIRHGQYFLGAAVVLTSAVSIGIFKVLLWLRKSAHPLATFSNTEAGLAWLRELHQELKGMQAKQGGRRA